MSALEPKPTFEEMQVKQATLQKELLTLKTEFAASKKADEDKNNDKDKQNDAAFKKAMKDMDEHTKESTHDMDKVKDAFKRANDETDPEKKKDAMKKAIDEKDDYMNKKSGKTANDDDKPKDEKKDAKVASLEDRFKTEPMAKVLAATRIIDPSNYDKIVKELTAATLDEVEHKYEQLKPFIAALGLEGQSSITPVQPTMGMIPFQASAATGMGQINPDNLYEASVETINFAKVKTSDIEGMYQ